MLYLILMAMMYVFHALYMIMRRKHNYTFEKSKLGLQIQVVCAAFCFLNSAMEITCFFRKILSGLQPEEMHDHMYCHNMCKMQFEPDNAGVLIRLPSLMSFLCLPQILLSVTIIKIKSSEDVL